MDVKPDPSCWLAAAPAGRYLQQWVCCEQSTSHAQRDRDSIPGTARPWWWHRAQSVITQSRHHKPAEMVTQSTESVPPSQTGRDGDTEHRAPSVSPAITSAVFTEWRHCNRLLFKIAAVLQACGVWRLQECRVEMTRKTACLEIAAKLSNIHDRAYVTFRVWIEYMMTLHMLSKPFQWSLCPITISKPLMNDQISIR